MGVSPSAWLAILCILIGGVVGESAETPSKRTIAYGVDLGLCVFFYANRVALVAKED